MPTYEYECKQCGHTFEAFQAMSDEPLKSCAKCGSEVRRLIFGGAGVIFKGSGFYVTDKSAAKPAAKNTGAGSKAPSPEAKNAASPPDGAPKPADAAAGAAAGAAGAKTPAPAV